MSPTPLRLRKAAVLGAGVMGAQIAAHLANADVETLLGDATKARKKLGWKPTTSFAELVKEMAQADFRQASDEQLLRGRRG